MLEDFGYYVLSWPVLTSRKTEHAPTQSVLIYAVVSCCHVQFFCDPMDCSLPSSSVHGISQARIPEWVAIPFSRGSSQPILNLHLLGLLHWQADSLLHHLARPVISRGSLMLPPFHPFQILNYNLVYLDVKLASPTVVSGLSSCIGQTITIISLKDLSPWEGCCSHLTPSSLSHEQEEAHGRWLVK